MKRSCQVWNREAYCSHYSASTSESYPGLRNATWATTRSSFSCLSVSLNNEKECQSLFGRPRWSGYWWLKCCRKRFFRETVHIISGYLFRCGIFLVFQNIVSAPTKGFQLIWNFQLKHFAMFLLGIISSNTQWRTVYYTYFEHIPSELYGSMSF